MRPLPKVFFLIGPLEPRIGLLKGLSDALSGLLKAGSGQVYTLETESILLKVGLGWLTPPKG